MSVPILEVKDLKKHFHTSRGTLHAVDGVNFTIGAGQTLGVVGESGCGKSTLGRTVLRLLNPTSGQVLFKGQDICTLNDREMAKMRSKMQMIFQDPYASLNPRMTVSEIIADPLQVLGKKRSKAELEEYVVSLMETVGLPRRYINAYPHELDGGRRQRIGIARALALDPEFVVCDEPVSALDMSIQAQILNLMMDLQESRNLTYMFISHDLSVVKHISDKIMVMYLGQCVEFCDSDELFANPRHPYTKALLAAVPIPKLNQPSGTGNLIKGEITSPINVKPGCRFAARCPYAKEECIGKDIPLYESTPGHQVACIRERR